MELRGSVDHDAVTQVERVLAEVTLDLGGGGVGRRDGFAGFGERPIGLGPDRILDFPQDFEMTLRRPEQPDAVIGGPGRLERPTNGLGNRW